MSEFYKIVQKHFSDKLIIDDFDKISTEINQHFNIHNIEDFEDCTMHISQNMPFFQKNLGVNGRTLSNLYKYALDAKFKKNDNNHGSKNRTRITQEFREIIEKIENLEKGRMSWEKLLSSKRVADYTACNTKSVNSQFTDPRSPFEKDIDQIIFSYPFRRLQDKTQVIPFPEFDFVHTRLTHSLEVASVGRSLGKMASTLIFQELSPQFIRKSGICSSDIGALVAGACLAHDIGNPPFGHSGEDAISEYFKTFDPFYPYNFNGTINKEDEDEYANSCRRFTDLSKFEGNANGFRILTNNCDKGINPTFALLGVFSKYPRESWLQTDPFSELSKDKKPKSQTKYGFFQEQKDLFKFVANELGLIPVNGINKIDTAFHRHPLAFIMEASDDIAYTIIDFEDGCRLDLIDFDKEYKTITIRQKDNSIKNVEINKSPRQILIDIAQKDKGFELEKVYNANSYKDAISYLRSKVINVLTQYSFEVFKQEYENIMCGKFDKALMDSIEDIEIQQSISLIILLNV